MSLHSVVLAAFLLAGQTGPQELPARYSEPRLSVRPDSESLGVTGNSAHAVVPDIAADGTAREQRLRLLREKTAQLDALQREIAQLRTDTRTPQQVLVKVQMLEVNLTKLRKVGVDFAQAAPAGGATGPNPVDLFTNNGNRTGQALEMGVVDADSAILGFLDALKQNNLAKVLAEPKAVVVSGRPASVNVGGEFPLPGIDGRPVEFRQFGTQLDLVAVTTGNNQVRLEIRARVSELDDAHAIVISGARVPRLNVREFDTAIEMAFGQTAVLSGLVQKRTESRRTAIGLTQDEQVEIGLAVVVTPEFIEPLAPAGAAATMPNGAITK